MKSEDLIRSAEILRDNCKSYGDDDDCEGCPFAGKDTVCRLTSVIHPAEWDVYSERKETDSNHSAEVRNMAEDHFREVTKKVEPERPAEVSKTITRADILDAAGNGEWSSQGCAIYYGAKCPHLRELPEEKKAEEAERVTVWQAAAEFGRSASDTWENANSATKTLADALYKPEEKDDD